MKTMFYHCFSTKAHLEQLLGQITTFIDPAVHRDESLHTGLVPDIGVMQAGVEHNDGERQDVARVCKDTIFNKELSGKPVHQRIF